MFSSQFLFWFIAIALIWTAMGALSLIVLLIKDWKKKQLW